MKLKNFDGEKLLNVIAIIVVTAYLIGIINFFMGF